MAHPTRLWGLLLLVFLCCRPVPPPFVLMLPPLPEDFLAFPWPNDIRHRADGTLDVAGYPGTAANVNLAIVVGVGSLSTRAFGTSSAVYFRTTKPLDPASFPSPSATLADASPVMLVNLDDPLAPRVPLLLDFKAEGTALRPENLLTLLPYPGYPLAETSRYAAILFSGLAGGGQALRRAPLLDELEQPWDAGKPFSEAQWNALQEQRDATFAYLAAHTDRSPDEVLGFSVFTTQDVTGEMEAIAAAVEALPPPAPLSRSAGNCVASGASHASVTGTLALPKWQAGAFPYEFAGGGIVVVTGQAVQQSTENVAFEMIFPCGNPPAGGWPILLFMDGTGASANADSISELGYTPLPGVLVASIAPLYSGDRAVPGHETDSELLFFNLFNPLAGRTNQLQQASEMLYLRRVVENLTLSAPETGAAAPVPTNDEVVMIAGHSQGALTIPLSIAVDDAFGAAFLSAGGAGLYHALVHRGDVRAIVDSLLLPAPGELDEFHPAMQALQTIVEVGDAATYAARPQGAHLLSVGGLKDGCSPWETISHLGTALGLPVANAGFHPSFGDAALEPAVTALPVAGNLPGGRTGVTLQLDAGHFGASTNPEFGRGFVLSFASGGGLVPPTVTGSPDPNNVPGCDGRADPLY